ncbi:coniferyl aldehyde dehydrogenase [Legionella taurinensis]|uniref:Aldehyde dehydrogenase n=1 Tax=Legionella taurinensis TaxID=70611 RepID=A0A3A5LPC7_9GAMM|nr:coniferyl aldehyde dehydrogenase [Legionella taurinensis]MDX1836798.1 coniferyl aldehyde dehydrogenase [Legionella taurinensis]PUT41465.1 coniferyl aldehyde dehydrogenase [Legionella taurinensis]PUT42444.1 coniferyl aldehyde dehydrogenase [Legionella taurinensis]PUT43946.1 coniferyl aldehyde dehydrogenase [Legionella taurinensis]PUT47225.1 coniferyl aldehyde dehydrogenase [Legionella taurinensis]
MVLNNLFMELMHEHRKDPYPSVSERRDMLKQLKTMLKTQGTALAAAINSDYSHRSQTESLFLEIAPSIKAIDYCLSHLKAWTKARKKRVSWHFWPASAYVLPQPLGVVGIIVPWNYPVYLSIVPLAYALAAGNRVMVKMSELSSELSQTLQKLLSSLPTVKKFVKIIDGDVEVGQAFSSLPFGHLLFTGSTQVGKAVMAAASQNLTPVTLELGGKSPAILSQGMDPAYLPRLFMGKLYNAGQTCIAPDYLLVPSRLEQAVETGFAEFLNQHYPDLMTNDNYTGIISPSHKQRLHDLLEDARQKGARVVQYGEESHPSPKMPVYLIFNVNTAMKVMNEEIFGPILPIMTYEKMADAIYFINSLPNPLALYYFGDNKDELNRLAYGTLSGALTVNDTLMHVAIDDLPFGGVGQSGFGQYHGQEGFDRFSQLKPVFKKKKIATAAWLYPPYGRLVHWYLRYVAGINLGRNNE